MTLDVVLTGTAFPNPNAERAGPGTLVRCGSTALQFDAGRATTMRLVAAGTPAVALTALFMTHHHSDHTVGIPDLVMSRWGFGAQGFIGPPLPVVAPEGPSARFAQRCLDPWDDDIAVRLEHLETDISPTIELTTFVPSATPSEMWTHEGVTVSSVLVHHEPVVPAVGYRVDTPDGSVVVSGDTNACDEMEELARGADVLVHEAMLDRLWQSLGGQRLAAYHTNAIALGGIAKRAEVTTLMLTHLMPSPQNELHEENFVNDIRAGGFEGEVIVGRDLSKCTV